VSIRKFQAFLKTVETGSITKAAAQLGYTQSAVSRMIADLEDTWGVTLLTRSHPGVEISSEGLLLLPALQALCKDYDDLKYAVSELHGLHAGLIRIGAFTSVATGWLPLMIKAFHEQYPNITFQLVNGEYNQIETWLRRGNIDCGFLALPVSGDLEARFLFQDALVAVLPPSHPMSKAPFFPVERLSAEDFISLKEEQDHEITRFLEGLKQKPNIRYEVSNDFAILSMVECGLGISVVHELMLHPNRYGIVKKHFDIPQGRSIGIAMAPGLPSSTVTRLFVQYAEEWAKELRPAIQLNTAIAT